MMSVVEQQAIGRPAAMAADPAPQLRIVPLVHDHDVDAIQRCVEIQVLGLVERATELGIRLAEILDRAVSILFTQIPQTPTVRALEDLDGVPLREQLRAD